MRKVLIVKTPLTRACVLIAGPLGLCFPPQAQLWVDGPQEVALPRPGRYSVRVVPGERHEV